MYVGAPAITGAARVGERLSVSLRDVDDDNGLSAPTYRYRWTRVDADGISNPAEVAAGAGVDSYTLADADLGKRIRVRLTFNDDEGYEEVLQSSAFPAEGTVQSAGNRAATGAPAIEGTLRVGERLTADIAGIDDADGLVGAVFSYQWRRVEADGAVQDIPGGNTPGYVLQPADQGKRVRVRVRFRDDEGNTETLASASSVVVAAPLAPAPPVDTSATGAPSISGTAQVGALLQAHTTDIADADGLAGVSWNYQWQRADADGASNPADIAGARASTYRLQEADQGRQVRVRVRFRDDGGNDEALASAFTEAVVPEANVPATGGPVIEGTARVGEVLRAGTAGIRDANGLRAPVYAYQWQRVGSGGGPVDIVGARSQGYLLTGADQGRRVRVVVRFDDSDGNAERLSSASTAPVLAAIEPTQQREVNAADQAAAQVLQSQFSKVVVVQALDVARTRLAAPRVPGVSGTPPSELLGLGGGVAVPHRQQTRPGGGGAGGAGSMFRSGASPDSTVGTGAIFAGGGASATSPFGGMHADGAADSTFAGVSGMRAPGAANSVTGAGGMPAGGAPPGLADAAPHRGPTLELPSGKRLLNASAFSLTEETSGGAFASLWARGDHSAFESRQDSIEVEGDVSTGRIGLDWASGALVAGLSAAHSQGRGDTSDDTDFELSLNGFYPYLGYRIAERLAAWATLGFGEGELGLEPEGRPAIDTDMEFRMGAFGAEGDLLKSAYGFALSLRGDAVFVRTKLDAAAGLARSASDTSRMRFGLVASRDFAFAGGDRLSPTLELGVLHDGGDISNGMGAELAAGLRYQGAGGLSIDLRGRSLVTHEVSGTRELGVSGELRYDPAPASELGIAFSLKSGVGAHAEGGVEEIFELRMSDDISELGSGSSASGGGGADALSAARLSAELGYGLSAFGGLFTGTPWARIGFGDAGASWRFGWRFAPLGARAPELRTGIEYGGRGAGAGHEIRFKLDTRF